MSAPVGTSAIVLLIDDESSDLLEASRTVTMAGHIAMTCSDAQSAIELAHRSHPDLIISDINLGVESGLDLCHRIKSEAGLSDVPVIFLSGAHIPDVVRRAHAAGGTYYIRKPFDPEVLLEMIEKALWMPQLVQNQVQVQNEVQLQS
jgi:CheY-like chemotaxis protein